MAGSDWKARAVLHVDMDAFFASIEQLDHPEWRGLPVIVGGEATGRGVVAAASYEARRFGVRSAMPAATAARLCPDAVWTRGRFDRYAEVSRLIREILESFSPSVQMASIDEGYLDVTPGPYRQEDPVEVARGIQAAVDDLGLSCSIGVATSKTVAKIASEKGKPHGITVVRPGEEATFLSPMAVSAMPGVGPATASRLESLGVRTLGQVARLDEREAARLLGSHGQPLVARARGIDPSLVVEREPARSISAERTFRRDVTTSDAIDAALAALAERVGTRMRRKGVAGRTLTVKIRYSDFTTRTVRRTLAAPTDVEATFTPVARELVRSVWSEGVGVRLLGVGMSGFADSAEQLDLFAEEAGSLDEREKALAEGVDAVRRRFGDRSVVRGTAGMGREVTDVESDEAEKSE